MLDVERFSVPEVLFHPSDIDIKQAGVPEAIVQAVQGSTQHTLSHSSCRPCRVHPHAPKFPLAH